MTETSTCFMMITDNLALPIKISFGDPIDANLASKRPIPPGYETYFALNTSFGKAIEFIVSPVIMEESFDSLMKRLNSPTSPEKELVIGRPAFLKKQRFRKEMA